MKIEEIKESNKLIARFMGGTLKEPTKEHPKNPYNKPTWWGVGTRPTVGNFSLSYHESWDWIIPVVEKIRSLDNMVNINFWSETNAAECVIYNWEDFGSEEIRNECESSIDSVYLSVIEFIKWYNQNTKDGK